MVRSRTIAPAIAATLLIIAFAKVATAEVRVALDEPSGRPGETIEIAASLMIDGDESVAGLELDVAFDSRTPVALRNDGRHAPDCWTSGDIDKGASGFGFRRAIRASLDDTPTVLHAVIVATDNVDVIPAGAELFRCHVTISPTAAPGQYTLEPRRARFALPDGEDRTAVVTASVIRVAGEPAPTATAQMTPTATAVHSSGGCQLPQRHHTDPVSMVIGGALLAWLLRNRRRPVTATPLLLLFLPVSAARATVLLEAHVGSGAPGDVVPVDVTLRSDGELVSGVQNDLSFDLRALAFVHLPNGKPDCEVNPAINKAATTFGFRPSGCGTTARPCSSIRAVVLAFDNVAAIAPGSSLYQCRILIAPDAMVGRSPILITSARYAPPEGSDQLADAAGAEVMIVAPSTSTPTITPSGTSTPQPTSTPSRTSTPSPTNAPSRTNTPSPTNTPPPSATSIPTAPDPGDTNCDAVVNDADVGHVGRMIFGFASACSADANRDGQVTAADVSLVISRLSAPDGARSR